MSAAIKQDYDQAILTKDAAAISFKEKNYSVASDKYFEILNIIRANTQLKDSKEGRTLESQARLNIALCKFNQKEYDNAVDQCERVLDKDPKNAKACFRLSQSVFQKYNEMQDLTDSGVK